MKQTITEYQFQNAFQDANRGENFSYGGLTALFEYFEELEESIGAEIEMDVIAICCEYTEYDNINEYNNNHDAVDDIDDIEQRTTVIRINDESFIIQDF